METFTREIFEQLGKLFYALAVDQEVSPMESGELKMLLRKDWLTESGHRSEDKISEAAHLIGLTIDSLQNEKVSPEEAYESFEKFYSSHREQFSQALIQKIFETGGAILKMFPAEGEDNAHFENLKILIKQADKTSELST